MTVLHFCWFYWNLCCWRSTRSSCSRSGCHCYSAPGLLWDLKQSRFGLSFPIWNMGITIQESPTGNSVQDTVLPSKCSEIMSWTTKIMIPAFANESVSHPGFRAVVVHILKLSPPRKQKVLSNQFSVSWIPGWAALRKPREAHTKCPNETVSHSLLWLLNTKIINTLSNSWVLCPTASSPYIPKMRWWGTILTSPWIRNNLVLWLFYLSLHPGLSVLFTRGSHSPDFACVSFLKFPPKDWKDFL